MDKTLKTKETYEGAKETYSRRCLYRHIYTYIYIYIHIYPYTGAYGQDGDIYISRQRPLTHT